jgi:hypothetical protein
LGKGVVIPAQAGIQLKSFSFVAEKQRIKLDPGLRRDDGSFCSFVQNTRLLPYERRLSPKTGG